MSDLGIQSLFRPLDFKRGAPMKNRFMLAPLTNSQSHEDGRLSDDEFQWLTMRAEGGFGLTMTCASHVQFKGKGFPGQLGAFGSEHMEGLTRLARAIKKEGSLAVQQLHHAGMRSPKDLIGEVPLCPSDNPRTGARAMTPEEVEEMVESFAAAAQRAEAAGFDGVELHGAHGYLLCQFLSAKINLRGDEYGGSLENRARVLFEVIERARARCGENFSLGVRLSPERFGLKLAEIVEIAQRLMDEGQVDYLDMSLWDVFKEPAEEEFQGKSLMSYFTRLKRGKTRLGVAGKIMTPHDALRCMEEGVDFVVLGRAGILHHDYPKRARHEADFTPVSIPVSWDYLKGEGLSETFIDYMGNWEGFVEDHQRD